MHTSDEAYVLHQRNYSESSLIIRLLTQDHGVVSVVAKGAKSTRSKFYGQTQAFIPTQVQWTGRSDLKTLIGAEQSSVVKPAPYLNHISMLYVSELMTLIPMDEGLSRPIYALYSEVIDALMQADKVTLILRRFEWRLAGLLGYALSVPDGETASLVFDPVQGLIAAKQGCPSDVLTRFVQGGERWDRNEMMALNQLMKAVVNHLVQGKKIKSRQLLTKPLVQK